MNIAILGTGRMAKALATLLAQAGHSVVLGSRDAGRTAAIGEELGSAVSVTGITEAVERADVVALAVPYDVVLQTIDAAGGLAGKTVIDLTNPLTADMRGLTVGHTTSAAEIIQGAAPDARVVKAFNTVFAAVLRAGGKIEGEPATIFVAADDADAKEIVSQLIADCGMIPVDSGALVASRLLEPVGLLNIALAFQLGHGNGIGPAWQGLASSAKGG